MQALTLYEAIFCNLLWLIAFFIFLPSLKKFTKKGNAFFLWIFMSLYSTFEFTGGDFMNYLEIYSLNLLSPNESIHLEDFYYWLMQILPPNYFLWRFCIWGLASFFWILTLKKLNQNIRFAGMVFLLIVFFLFVGARQALCFSVLYYTLSILQKDKQKLTLQRICVCILLTIGVYFLHKTAIVYIIITGISLFPFGKKTLIISLILFPIIYKVFDFISFYFISEYSSFNEQSASVMERYMEGESLTANINGVIRLIIDRSAIFLLLFYSIWKIYFKNEVCPKVYLTLLKISYLLIYISYLFTGRDISKFIAPRFWDAALFPFTLFIAGYMFNKRNSIFFKACIILLILSKLYSMSYIVYKL